MRKESLCNTALMALSGRRRGSPGSPSQGESASSGWVQGRVKDVTQRRCRTRSRHASQSRVVEEAGGDRALQRDRQEAPPTSLVCQASGATRERVDILGPGGHQLRDHSTRRIMPSAPGFARQDGELAVRVVFGEFRVGVFFSADGACEASPIGLRRGGPWRSIAMERRDDSCIGTNGQSEPAESPGTRSQAP